LAPSSNASFALQRLPFHALKSLFGQLRHVTNQVKLTLLAIAVLFFIMNHGIYSIACSNSTELTELALLIQNAV
jgi:DNA-binding MarR family transcriptional regulator